MTTDVTPLQQPEATAHRSRDIVLLVALSDPSHSKAYGAALWAAAREIASFCESDAIRARFSRRYISEHIPSQVQGGGLVHGARRWFAGLFGVEDDDAGQNSFGSSSIEPSLLESARGHYLRTYEAERLAALVSLKQADEGIAADFNLIVTDRELTPDGDLRYVLWWYDDEAHAAAVVSTVTLDPAFWRTSDERRTATVKHRVRTACLWNILHFFGGQDCDNQSCFLYGHVNSYSDLDRMTRLGSEHPELSSLVGRGFERSEHDPVTVQSIREIL